MAEPQNVTRWKVVALSFVGAATFWFFSALGKEYSYRFRHPITFVYDTDSLIAIQPLPKYVDIDVTGDGWDLFKEINWFGSDPVVFTLENPAGTSYLTRASILPVLTEQLSEFRINFLFTDTLAIAIDAKTSRKVRVMVDSTLLDLEPSHRLVSPVSLSPDSVVISGPESFLDTLVYGHIAIEEKEIDRPFDQLMTLTLPAGLDIVAVPPAVQVSFEVERFERLEIPIQIEPIGFPEDSSVILVTSEVAVGFSVRASLKRDYAVEDFMVIVDYAMVDKQDSTAPSILMFHPEEVVDVTLTPDSVKVQYVR